MSRRRLVLLCAASGLFCGNPGPALAEPVEYVRVCDAYGSGYFYIPGTETCLFLQGRTGVSVLENPSDLGVGVVRRQIGLNFSETFGSGQANYLWRYGGGFSARRELGEFEQFERFNVVPTGYVYFDFDFALGSSGENGWVQSGGDVQGLGFTFLYPDMGLGNGVIAVGPGWSLQSHTDTDYSWGLGSAGFGKTYPIDLGGSGGGLTFSAGPYVETLQYDSDGRGEIFFNNAPVNLDQTYRYDASDWWAGLRGDIKVNWHPSHNWFLSTGVYATAGYHRGEASIRQITNTPFAPPNDIVDQWLNYSGSDFSIGGGANFSAGYVLSEHSQVGFNAEVSVLPDVTAFRIPENPGQIPGVFFKEDVLRFFFNVTYQRQFPVD